MHYIIFLIILFLIWMIFGVRIRQWFAAFMARRTEDLLRKAAGLPPRPDSRKARRQQRAREKAREDAASERGSYYRGSRSGAGSSRRRRGNSQQNSGPIIPKEYAVDVDYVETKTYSETTIGAEDPGRGRQTVYHESQVSDAEWEEIKIRKK